MKENNKLEIYNQFDQLQRAAVALYRSNYFGDAKNQEQAIVKVMAGAELGLPPFASMTGIHIIKGKPALGANVLATLIKNDPRYNYKVLEHTAQKCSIEFYEEGEKCGISEFTLEEAKKAGTQNLDKFPKNMLFARAISNGAKWYTPGIFGGSPVYTPDELGATVNEDGEIIEHREESKQTKVITEKPVLTPVSPRWVRAVQQLAENKITIEEIKNYVALSDEDEEEMIFQSDELAAKLNEEKEEEDKNERI